MSWLAKIALTILHFLYACITTIVSWKTHWSRIPPPSVERPRARVPLHLALVLAAEDYDFDQKELVRECLLESLQNATVWCQTVGIRKLTVYDRHGILSNDFEHVSQRHYAPGAFSVEDSSSESDIEYPLTPPLSDTDSRPLSPTNIQALNMNVITLELPITRSMSSKTSARTGGVKRRRKQSKSLVKPSRPLTTHIISRLSGKPTIAQVATALLRDANNRLELHDRQKEFSIEVNQVNSIIEGNSGVALPELTIVHNVFPNTHWTKRPMEFHGFPPWQLRLSEFYYTENLPPRWPWWAKTKSAVHPVPLDETEFDKALEQYSSAEMRLGK